MEIVEVIRRGVAQVRINLRERLLSAGTVILEGVVYHLVARVRRRDVVPLTMYKRVVQK